MPNANDNCGIASFELSHESGTAFPVGTTLVTALATDEAGNSAEGSFEVTVLDNENPAILNLSNDITVPNDSRECGAEVTWSHKLLDLIAVVVVGLGLSDVPILALNDVAHGDGSFVAFLHAVDRTLIRTLGDS